MWGVFSMSDPRAQERKWGILLHQCIFPPDYMKFHVKSLQNSYTTLTWSGLYLRINFQNALLHRVLALVPLTDIEPEVYVYTMTKFISVSYDDLGETLNHLNSLNI